MFGFGKKRKKREEEQRRAAEAAAAAQRARLAEEMAKAEEMRKAEMEARDEAKRAAAAEAAKAEAQQAAPTKTATVKKPTAKKPAAKKQAVKQSKAEPAAKESREETAGANGKFEIKRTSDGRYMFNVRAGNTQVIASSQIYSSMAACKNGIASVGANAPVAAIEDQTLQTINEEKCPKFQIYFDKAGQYRFNLIATNGNNILSCTQGYKQKSSCKNGVRSVIANACATVEILKDEK